MNKKITPRNVNFANWYTSVIQEANLIQYTDVKGFMIFEPNGWAIWENIKTILSTKFKNLGIKDVYMPLLIPMAEFKKEKEHVEGFAPELYTVTHIGNKVLEDYLAIRPTSEIWFCKYFKNKIHSYKDLPCKVNQWTSVLRAEKNTRPFLRNSEFHWHEVHAVFSTLQEADDFSKLFLDLYSDFCEHDLCIPVIKGIKTEHEKFAGADKTYTIESMMQDGQALQSATSHVLGQNFTKSYEIKFQNSQNTLEYAWQTSHGLTTRIIGAIIMVHSDDNGLVLPWKIANTQIRIIALHTNKNPQIYQYAETVFQQLNNQYRCELINNDKGLGYLLADSEVNGIPINIIIGESDFNNQTITYNTRLDNTKHTINVQALDKTINECVTQYQSSLYAKAKQKLDNNIVDVNNLDDFKKVIANNQWARCYFAGTSEDEQNIKTLTSASTRCIISDENTQIGECFYTKKPTNRIIIFAKAY